MRVVGHRKIGRKKDWQYSKGKPCVKSRIPKKKMKKIHTNKKQIQSWEQYSMNQTQWEFSRAEDKLDRLRLESEELNFTWDHNVETRKKRPRERPRWRWIDPIKKDLKLLGIRDGEQLAKDREAWRDVVKVAMNIYGPIYIYIYNKPKINLKNIVIFSLKVPLTW